MAKPTVGTQVKVAGLDMQCRRTIETMRIVRVLDETDPKYGFYDCVLQGCEKNSPKILSHSNQFLFV